MPHLIYLLFCGLFCLTTAISKQDLQRQISDEVLKRKKLENNISEILTQLEELKANQGPSYVRDEIAVINDDIAILSDEMAKIKKIVSKIRKAKTVTGVGNSVPSTGLLNGLKQQVSTNTRTLLKLKSDVESSLSVLKQKQNTIVVDVNEMKNKQTTFSSNVSALSQEIGKLTTQHNDIKQNHNTLEKDLVSTKNLQRDLSAEVGKLNKSLHDVKKKQNDLTKANVDIINITSDQKIIKKKQEELITEQTTINKKQKLFDANLNKISKAQTIFSSNLTNIKDTLYRVAINVAGMEKLLNTSNLRKPDIEKKMMELAKSQNALFKGLGDLKIEILNGECCKGKGGSGQKKERLKGRMHDATAKPLSSKLQWKASNGKKFLALVPSTYKNYERDITIMIRSSKSGWYYVDNPYLGIKVNKTMSAGNNVYTIADDINVKPQSTERNSFWIEMSHSVTLFLMSTRSRSSDGYHVIPYKSLAKNHVISTTEPYGRYERYKCYLPTFVSVGAVHDNTKVSFKLKTSGYLKYNKRRYYTGHTLSVTLDRYETFELQHCHDLSGTFVTSSAPIAVVSGNQCNRVGSGSCSQLADMVTPMRSLSSDYVLPVLPDRPGSLIHIVATADGTSLTIHRKTTSKQTTTTKSLNAGQFYETTIENGVLMAVKATRPVLVSQAINGTYQSDPMMLIVPGESQFQSSYGFSVPAYKFKSSASVMVESSDRAGLRLDGNPLKLNKKAVAQMNINGKKWSLFAMRISSGSHEIKQTSKHPFGLVIYGDGHRDGYAYSAGMTINSG